MGLARDPARSLEQRSLQERGRPSHLKAPLSAHRGAAPGFGGNNMSEILVNLIIQAVGGAIGGNAIGATLKNMNLGPLGNTIAGALGGAGGGSILSALIPALSGGAGGLDIGALAGQFVGGGATGAIVTAIVGAIVNGMKSKA
jgi:hypothetical protein